MSSWLQRIAAAEIILGCVGSAVGWVDWVFVLPCLACGVVAWAETDQ